MNERKPPSRVCMYFSRSPSGDVRVPEEADLLHLHLGVLVDDEDHVDLVVRPLLEAVADLGEEVALLDVLLLDLLHVLADGGEVEEGERLQLDRVLQVVLGELVVALDARLAHRGPLGDAVDEDRRVGAALAPRPPRPRSSRASSAARRSFVDARSNRRARPSCARWRADRVHLDAPVPLDADVGDARRVVAVARCCARPRAGRGGGEDDERGEEGPGFRGGEARHGGAESKPTTRKAQTVSVLARRRAARRRAGAGAAGRTRAARCG